MPAEAVFEGRALVCRSISPELAIMAKPDILGKPMGEVYTEPGYAPILGLIEWVMITGCPVNTLFSTPYGLTGWVSVRRLAPEKVVLRFRRVPQIAGARVSLRDLTRTAAAVLVAALSLPGVVSALS